MGFDWLDFGFLGAFEAALIAVVTGFVLFTLAHALRHLVRWRQGTAIGVAFVLTLLVATGVDVWNLFYLSIVRLESPFAIQQTLEQIHDPDALGMRVVLEFIGAVVGVTLGWMAWGTRG